MKDGEKTVGHPRQFAPVEVIHYGTNQIGRGHVEDPDHSTEIRLLDFRGEVWQDGPGQRGLVGNLLTLDTEEQAFQLLRELGNALGVEIPYDRIDEMPWPGDDYVKRHAVTSAWWAARRVNPVIGGRLQTASTASSQMRLTVKLGELQKMLEAAVETGYSNGFADAVASLRLALSAGQLLRRSAVNIGRRIVSSFKPGVRVLYEIPRLNRRGDHPQNPEDSKRYGTVVSIDQELTVNEHLRVKFDDGEERQINQDVMRTVREGDKDPKAVQ